MPTKNPSQSQKRKWNLSARYGMTEEDYQRMLTAQNGLCAICGDWMSPPVIDHCHQTGRVRGLLCHECNIKLPVVEDTAFIMCAWGYLDDCG